MPTSEPGSAKSSPNSTSEPVPAAASPYLTAAKAAALVAKGIH